MSVIRELTVARIRERGEAAAVDVMFLESARIYKLPRDQPRFRQTLARLREGLATKRAVTVTLPSLDADEIEAVQAAVQR